MKFYIGKRSCGCIVAGHTDTPDTDRKLLSRWIASWVKDGLTVEHIAAEQVTIPMTPCEHERHDDHGPLFARASKLLALALFFCLIGTAHAFDLPFLGLFCQGNCSYSGSITYNDPAGILTSTISATATGNLGGNSGDISGSLFTQWGGTCWYGTSNCVFPLYPFPPQNNGGCAPSGNILRFCYQDAGPHTCQETFSGGWNATAAMHTGAYVISQMQSDLGVTLNVNNDCPPGRPDILTLDVNSIMAQDCDGNLNGGGAPIPPFYCNEQFNVVAPSEENGNPISGFLNRSDTE